MSAVSAVSVESKTLSLGRPSTPYSVLPPCRASPGVPEEEGVESRGWENSLSTDWGGQVSNPGERERKEGSERDFECRNQRVAGSCWMTMTLRRGGRGLSIIGLVLGGGVGNNP